MYIRDYEDYYPEFDGLHKHELDDARDQLQNVLDHLFCTDGDLDEVEFSIKKLATIMGICLDKGLEINNKNLTGKGE